MNADYYDPHPFAPPDRPVVLLGHPGSGVALVGRALAGLTGWAFHDVERLVEARTTRSRGRIAVEDGIPALAALERALLRQAVESARAGVVTSDPLCLAGGQGEVEEEQTWLGEGALTIALRRPMEHLLDAITRQRPEALGSFPDFVIAVPRNGEELARHLADRDAVLERAEVVVDAGGRAALTLAEEIRERLDVRVI